MWNKILIKKEWMEQRYNILSMFVTLLILWGLMLFIPKLTRESGGSLEMILEGKNLVYWMMLFLVAEFGVILGVWQLGTEKAQRTLSYLMTRPVTRKEILSAKILIGLGSTLGFYLTVRLLTPYEVVVYTDPQSFINLPLDTVYQLGIIILSYSMAALVTSQVSHALGAHFTAQVLFLGLINVWGILYDRWDIHRYTFPLTWAWSIAVIVLVLVLGGILVQLFVKQDANR